MHNVAFVPPLDQLVFYPIGNTPAVNLLCQQSQNPAEDTPTEVLALACGDPRSILYSLWSEGNPERHKVNFTCCDLEPAVLARNILLFSLMIDCAKFYESAQGVRDPKLSAIWNLCYHFYVPKHDIELLREQATKLLEYSENIEIWAKCPYSTVKFVSLQTIDEVRSIWTKYVLKRDPAAQASYESARRSEVRAAYDYHYGTGGESMTFYAGPHWGKGLDTMNVSLRKYWKSGVVAGNAADIEALGWSFIGHGAANPMMMVSLASEQFVVHFSSDPLTGFHLASAFDGKKDKVKDLRTMVTLAKSQFFQWSKAFVDYAKPGSVSVNVYYGDAVTLCHELAARNSPANDNDRITRVFTTQWSAKPFLLNGNAVLPAYFDVIDTSNLADWIGLHNLLPPTIQILAPKRRSVLYTETLRLSCKEPELDLCEALFMDVDLASLMIGVAPMGHIFGYTVENSHGEDLVHLENPRRYRMRIPWRVPFERNASNMRPLKVEFEWEELCEIFFGIYLKMFEQEDLTKAMAASKKPGYRPQANQTFNRYTRMSLATLIKHTMRNLQTDWVSLFPALLNKIEADTTLNVGRDTSLDFFTHLHINGALIDGRKSSVDTKPISKQPGYRCVTLVIPRKRLHIFEKLGGAPGIHLSIMRGDNEYRFFSVDCFFGILRRNEDGTPGELIEDPLGWTGKSNLIVTCPVSTTLLVDGMLWDCALKVTMAINSIDYMLESSEGDMAIYKTSSKDKKHVFISDSPPGTSTPVMTFLESNLGNGLDLLTIKDENTVVISASLSKGLLLLQAKFIIGKDSAEATALQSAAFVTLTDITPCSILLGIGDKLSRRLVFPYPVNGHKATTRIARKSLWIEVNVPVASAKDPGGYDADPFPVVLEKSQPYSWTLPRVDLSKQPAISSKDTKDWIWDINQQMLSAREKDIVNKSIIPTDFRSTLPYFKKTMHQLILNSCTRPEIKILLLVGKEKGREMACDTLIVADCLRHGRESSGLILDAWVVPIPVESSLDFMFSLPKEPGKAQVWQLRKAESEMWKRFFPAAVESCRRHWSHGLSCEYVSVGHVPLSVEDWKSPICRCGEGKDTSSFPKISFVARFKEVATKIAIPMLSAVSYVERMDPTAVLEDDD